MKNLNEELQNNQKSYNLQWPCLKELIKQISSILLAFIPLFFILEGLTYIPGAEKVLPPPSPGFLFSFPEVELKFKKYFKNNKYNCLIFGSSIVDAGVDPITLENLLNLSNDQQLTCMNFGLSGSLVEITNNIARTLINWKEPDIVFLGLSPFDFGLDSALNKAKTRSIAKMPVFTYYSTKSFEGWLFNTFRLPWYFVSLPNQRDQSYLEEFKSWDDLLNDRGMRNSEKVANIKPKYQDIRLRKFTINPVDLAALDSMIKELKKKNIKVIVFDMPTKPFYLPYIIGGGQAVYKRDYLEPINQVLTQNNIELIPFQINSTSLNENQYWSDKTHLNHYGAKVFSIYLAEKIIEKGDWYDWK